MERDQLDTMYRVAFMRFNSGRFEDSLKIFRYLCLLDHTSYSYFLGFGLSQYELSQFASAAATFSHTEKLNDKDPRASLMMAKSFVKIKQWHLARDALSEAVRRASQSAEWGGELKQAKALISFVDDKLQ